jgi:uncharacterized protein with ParB-like and HNH nuclease domain
MQKYAVNQQLIEPVLASIKAGEIAIPEIQRPFVWNAFKVRDLMDNLYQGHPVGVDGGKNKRVLFCVINDIKIIIWIFFIQK